MFKNIAFNHFNKVFCLTYATVFKYHQVSSFCDSPNNLVDDKLASLTKGKTNEIIASSKPNGPDKKACCISAGIINTDHDSIGNVVASDPFINHRPNCKEWQRVDDTILTNPKYEFYINNNAFHDTLNGEGLIEKHEIYVRTIEKKDDGENNKDGMDNIQQIKCLLKFGNGLSGIEQGCVHNGVLSLCFDNCFGWLFIAYNMKPGVTANLNINIFEEITTDSVICIDTELTESKDMPSFKSANQKRKKYLYATMTNMNSGVIVADATSLFITPKWFQIILNNAYMFYMEKKYELQKKTTKWLK